MQQYTDLHFKPGEAKKKLALLSFSSGTTGKPKAVMIPHYSIIANIVQMGQYLNLNDDYIPLERKLYRPGNVTLGGASVSLLGLYRDTVTLYIASLIPQCAVLPFYRKFGAVPAKVSSSRTLLRCIWDAHGPFRVHVPCSESSSVVHPALFEL